MPAAPDDFSALHQHRADHRIRRSRAKTFLRQRSALRMNVISFFKWHFHTTTWEAVG
jgi:hypothetical protein